MKSIGIIVLNLMVVCLYGQSLSEYVDIALANNPAIRARQMEAEVTRQKIDQVTALPDPQVNISAFMNPMMLPMGNQVGSVSAMQMFPWFGSLDARSQEIQSQIGVDEKMIDVSRNELSYRIKVAWIPLQEIEEKIKIKKENLRILQNDHDLASAKFQFGKGPMVNVVRADIMIDELKTDITLLEQKRKPLVAVFNHLLNRPEETPIQIDGQLAEPNEYEVSDSNRNISDNPNLLVYDEKMRLSDAQANSAEFMRKPMIGAGLQYMLQVQRKNNDINLLPNTGKDMIMPMFSLTIPIWKKKYDAAVQEREVMKTVYLSEKEALENDLASVLAMTVYEIDEASQKWELIENQKIKVRQAIDLLEAAYQNDGNDFEEMLRLQQKLFNYQLEEVSIKKDLHIALAKREYLIGKK
ncbi:MAG: TolC family protein [Saprospiraceae bacterium]|nr:TolC family protein [Saprospiraceae bacterium]